MINNGLDIPKWMTTGKTIICQKDSGKRSTVDSYWPISYLPLMWNLKTGTIANNVYEYLEMHNLLSVQQKGWRRNIHGTKDQLLKDTMVLNDCKKETQIWEWHGLIIRKLLCFTISRFLKSLNNCRCLRILLDLSGKQWKVGTQSWHHVENIWQRLISEEVYFRQTVWQFVTCMITLTQILRKVESGNTLKNGEKLNHVLFIDRLKIFAKSEHEVKWIGFHCKNIK